MLVPAAGAWPAAMSGVQGTAVGVGVRFVGVGPCILNSPHLCQTIMVAKT